MSLHDERPIRPSGFFESARSVSRFIVLWFVPVAAFAYTCGAVVGDVNVGQTVRIFLSSTELLCITLGFFGVCFALERVAPYRADWNQFGRAERNDWALYFLAVIPSEVVARALVFAVVPWLVAQSPVSPSHFWPDSLPLWVQVALGLLCFDFAYYWYHRLSHEHEWLWAWQRLHHTPEYLIASKGFRHTFVEWGADIVLHTTFFALVGMPPGVIFWVYAISMPIGILSHANIGVPNLPGLAAFLNLPGAHRIHHDRDLLGGGLKNYSAFTMFWDHVFGTFVSPERYTPRSLGVTEYDVPENIGQLWFSFSPRLSAYFPKQSDAASKT